MNTLSRIFPTFKHVLPADRRLWIADAFLVLQKGGLKPEVPGTIWYITQVQLSSSQLGVQAKTEDVRLVVFDQRPDDQPYKKGTVIRASGWFLEGKEVGGRARPFIMFTSTRLISAWTHPPAVIPERNILKTTVRGTIDTRWGGSNLARWLIVVTGVNFPPKGYRIA